MTDFKLVNANYKNNIFSKLILASAKINLCLKMFTSDVVLRIEDLQNIGAVLDEVSYDINELIPVEVNK